MKRSDKRSSLLRWRALRGAALALGTVMVIGLTALAPAKAEGGWEGHHHSSFGFSVGVPVYGGYYGYYGYPAYPAYGYYPYYGGYYPYYYGPSVSFSFGHR